MSKLTNNTSILDEQSSSNQTDSLNSNSTTKTNPIPGTPFMAVKHNEMWHIMWGKYVLSPGDELKADCYDRLENDYWNIMGTFVMSVMTAREEQINEMMQAMKKRTETLATPEQLTPLFEKNQQNNKQ